MLLDDEGLRGRHAGVPAALSRGVERGYRRPPTRTRHSRGMSLPDPATCFGAAIITLDPLVGDDGRRAGHGIPVAADAKVALVSCVPATPSSAGACPRVPPTSSQSLPADGEGLALRADPGVTELGEPPVTMLPTGGAHLRQLRHADALESTVALLLCRRSPLDRGRPSSPRRSISDIVPWRYAALVEAWMRDRQSRTEQKGRVLRSVQREVSPSPLPNVVEALPRRPGAIDVIRHLDPAQTRLYWPNQPTRRTSARTAPAADGGRSSPDRQWIPCCPAPTSRSTARGRRGDRPTGAVDEARRWFEV